MLRVADVLANFSSTRYSRDVMFYVGRNKHGDLEAKLAVGGEHSISSVLKRGATTRTIDGNQWANKTSTILKLPAADGDECVVCDVIAGGDMVVAHAG
eukprot:3646634-Pleurochrysis_carterae.AAC.2